MVRPWPELAAFFADFRRAMAEQAFADALCGVEAFSAAIAGGPLGDRLFGWTSMHDLCIQQTPAAPLIGPYLRIAPQPSGMVEFRYYDTARAERQWHREVSPDACMRMLEQFLEHLHWIARG